ncbi:MAG: hypothetical protein IT369_17105 [Candidatus Latescibacteria bacterium]|nr:hypothetical protein [Candidatus Latescibacterota bacterium]
MTTLTQPRSVLSLLWQTLRLTGRHFLPLFAIGGIPWAVFSLIPILLGQPQTLGDLKRAQVPITWDLLYPFLWAYLYALLLFPLANGALVHATAQALQGRPVRVTDAYRAAWPCWGRLMAVYLLYGVLICSISLIFAAMAYGYQPESWHGPEELIRSLVADARLYYYVALINFYPQILVLEGASLRQAWTRSRQFAAKAMGRLGWVLVIFMLLGMLGIEVLLPKVGQWAAVLGSGLTNLLCLVGVTGVYWEGREGVKEGR